ncbi:MAG: DUF167 family protein [Granulosicoccaceae bacterium]|jgi:uncharacterized protein (TIGR00251 family)
MASHYYWDGDTLVLKVRVQPKASRNELAGLHGDALKIRLTAPPVDGKANAALLKFLAKTFGVPQSSIIIETGQTGRNKRLRIPSPRTLPPDIQPA